MRLHALGDCSDKGILANIRCRYWLKPRNNPALPNSLLIGCRCITRCRVLVHGDGHFFRTVIIRVDDTSCPLRLANCGQVLASAGFPSNLGKQPLNDADRDNYLARKQSVRDARRLRCRPMAVGRWQSGRESQLEQSSGTSRVSASTPCAFRQCARSFAIGTSIIREKINSIRIGDLSFCSCVRKF